MMIRRTQSSESETVSPLLFLHARHWEGRVAAAIFKGAAGHFSGRVVSLCTFRVACGACYQWRQHAATRSAHHSRCGDDVFPDDTGIQLHLHINNIDARVGRADEVTGDSVFKLGNRIP